MDTPASLDGIVPVIPIPFLEDESIDIPSFRKTVEFVATREMAALCLPAYGSEYYKLTDAEREEVVGLAIEVSAGRMSVVAQVNHPSARAASTLAQRYEAMGASFISFAIPRQFGATDADRLHYCGQIADAVSCPILIQDFNPGGPTVGVDFISTLHQTHPNVEYFKLEEPLLADKIASIKQQLGDSVGVLVGWGGYYMIETLPVGICGVMPGVPICDLLASVYHLHREGEVIKAYELFHQLLPYLAYSLQDFELFLQIEKRLMVRRGLFQDARCRALTRTLSSHQSAHADFLIDRIAALLDQQKLL